MNQFTLEQFRNLTIIHSAIYRLTDKHNALKFEGEKVVLEYIKTHNPEHWQENRDFRIDFLFEEDGIDVSYLTKFGGGFGSMEEEREGFAGFRLKYKDVFGWEMPWKQPVCKLSEAKELIAKVL